MVRAGALIASAALIAGLGACGSSAANSAPTTTVENSWRPRVEADSRTVSATLTRAGNDSDAHKIGAMIADCTTGERQVATWQADVATIPAAAVRVPYSKAVSLFSQGFTTCAGADMADALPLFDGATPYLHQAAAAIRAE